MVFADGPDSVDSAAQWMKLYPDADYNLFVGELSVIMEGTQKPISVVMSVPKGDYYPSIAGLSEDGAARLAQVYPEYHFMIVELTP